MNIVKFIANNCEEIDDHDHDVDNVDATTFAASSRLIDLSLRPKYIYIDCAKMILIYNYDYMQSYLPKRKINLDSIGICIEPRLAHGYHLMGMLDALVLALENQYSSFQVFASRPLLETYRDPLFLFPTVEDEKHGRKFNQHGLISQQTRAVMSHDYKLLNPQAEGMDYVIVSNLVIFLPPSFQTVDALQNSIMRKTDDSSTNVGKKEKFFTMIANAGVIGHNQDELLRYFIAFALEKIVTRRFLVGSKVRKDSKKRKLSMATIAPYPQAANTAAGVLDEEYVVDLKKPLPEASAVESSKPSIMARDYQQAMDILGISSSGEVKEAEESK
jgi:hypothetical protein